MVKYSYDAYGKCSVASDSTTSKIGTINPFRFKGYYLDTETGFYYCNSRYYVPDWGRWLTADSIEYLDTNSVYGMNLYAYCYNNPISFVDENGHKPNWWQSILIGLGIIAATALIVTAVTFTGGTATAFFAAVGKTALVGLKIAAVAGATSALIRTGRSLEKNIRERNTPLENYLMRANRS